MENYRRIFLLAAAAFIGTVGLNLFSAPFAIAQEEKAQKEYELEIMTVTAEKREENIQEVPASITTLSDVLIEDAGIVDVEEMIQQIPNMFMVKTGNHTGQKFFIRGIGGATTDPAVGLYVDDVSISSTFGYDIELFGVERIEVLRGPQGTLYGRNTMGGVVNIITKKPGNQYEGKASVTYGNYNSQDYRAMVSGPMVKDKLLFGISGIKYVSDGYFDNKYLGTDDGDEKDDTNGRVHLRWLPTDVLDITLSGNIDTYEGGFDSFAPISEARKHNTMMDYHGDVENDANGQSLRVLYDAPWFKLTSITARRDLECTQTFDMDFTSDDIYRTYQKNEHKQWSQELRLSSHNDDSPLEWLVGAYYFDEEMDNSLTYDMRQGFPAWGIPPFKQNQPNSLDTEGQAFFGQATYTLFEKLGLTAGLRYDHEEKDFDGKMYYDQDLSAWGMLPITTEGEKTSEEWLPKFVIDYSCTSDLMTYVSVARGYKSGGFNIWSSSLTYLSYDPEYSWNYELGLKSSWLDNRFIFNTALFYIDWKDQQITQLLSANDWVIKNAGESHSQGFEVELLARPITGLELTAGFGYTDAKYDDYKDPLAGANYDDKRISNAPEYTYNLAAQYRYASGFFARVDLLGVGGSYYDDANTQTEDAYEIVNIRLGYEGEYKGFGFDVYVWAKNLFDKEYATRAFDMGGGNWFGRGGDPQTFGITLTGRF